MHVSLGNDHDVDGCLGIDVPEADHVLCVMNDAGGDLASHDSAEQALIGHLRLLQVSNARAIATAPIAAVSKRNVTAPSDAVFQPRSRSVSSSSGSKPPSGPTAM